MPQTIVIELFREWAERHGGRWITLDDGRLLFSDGATNDERDLSRREPPASDYQRLKLCRLFWSTKLGWYTKDFNALQHALTGHGEFHWNPAQYGKPVGDGPAALRHIAKLAKHARAQVDRIDSEMDQTPEMIEARHKKEVREQMESERIALESRIASEARSITLND